MNANSIYEKSIGHFLRPVTDLLLDPEVSEVMINGTESIYFERAGQIEKSPQTFATDKSLMAAIRNIAEFVGRPLYDDCHSLDARLPTGERVHAIWPPSSRIGVCLTIRKFNHNHHSLKGLIRSGVLSANAAKFLSIAVKLKKNMIISGGTGTGKTTILNALSAQINENERIVVIEDSSELKLRQKHTIYLETQNANEHGNGGVTIRDLFVDSLRMRPDRIIVGEVRRGEALDLVQSMTSGHSGSLSTVHASSPQDAVSRLETLCLMSDTSIPIYVARSQVASAIDLVVQLVRHPGGRRSVKCISECLGLDQNERYQWQDLFREKYVAANDGTRTHELRACENKPTFVEEATDAGFDLAKTMNYFPQAKARPQDSNGKSAFSQ